MEGNRHSIIFKSIESVTPNFVRAIVKKLYQNVVRLYNRFRYIEKGRFVEFGSGLRYDRPHPFRAFIGYRTILEVSNIWNTMPGDIKAGKKYRLDSCSIILSGVKIQDNVIISAGSVVTKDISAGSLVGGNPPRNLSAFAHKTLKLTETKHDKKALVFANHEIQCM